MRTDFLTRQLAILPTKCLNHKITIIGAGAIGSFTALSLAKMGFENITVIDDDIIDPENMNCQFFRHTDIDKPKVEALQELIKDFTGVTVEAINGRWTGQELNGIVITAVDNMAVRKRVYDIHSKKGKDTAMVFDVRMGAEVCLFFAYNPNNTEECNMYKNTLYKDSEAVQERCTEKSTIYCVMSVCGMLCSGVKAFVTAKDFPRSKSYQVALFDMV